MALEADTKKAIDALLDSYAPLVFYEKWVPGGYGKTGLDYNVCVMGRALYIEAKRPGKYPTGRQRDTLRAAHYAGAACFVISTREGVAALARWLKKVTGR